MAMSEVKRPLGDQPDLVPVAAPNRLRQLDTDGYVDPGADIDMRMHSKATLRRDDVLPMTVISPVHDYAYATLETDTDADALPLPPTRSQSRPPSRLQGERAASVTNKIAQLNRERFLKRFWFGLCIAVVVSLILSLVAIFLVLQKSGCDCPAESTLPASLGSSISDVTTDTPSITTLGSDAALRQEVSDLTATVSGIGVQLSDLRLEFNALDAFNASALTATVSDIGEEVSSLRSEINAGTLNSTDNGEGDRSTIVQAAIDQLSERLTTNNDRLRSVMADVVEDIDAKWTTVNGNITALHSQLDQSIAPSTEINETISDILTAINRNTLNIDNLEATNQGISDGIEWFPRNMTTFLGNLVINNGFADGALFVHGAFSHIQTVNGAVTISGNTRFTDIHGLNNLTDIISYLKITNNINLADISELNNLRAIGDDLKIYSNANLVNISGLNNVRTIQESLQIYRNNNLNLIGGLMNLTTITGDLQIYSNNNLHTISGLTGLTDIGDDLEIYDNTNLNSLSGLTNLRRIYGTIRISNNSGSIDYQSLNGITCHGGIQTCEGCPQSLLEKPSC